MKKLMLIFVVIVATSCSDFYNDEIDRLQGERKQLAFEVDRLNTIIRDLSKKETKLHQDIESLSREREILASGYVPEYVVTFEIKQGTFTLDIGEHIKNRVNAVKVDIPVSKQFYNRVTIGEEINRSFKYGSLIFNGDFSNLKLKVVDKKIITARG